jgi:hypothetical protein
VGPAAGDGIAADAAGRRAPGRNAARLSLSLRAEALQIRVEVPFTSWTLQRGSSHGTRAAFQSISSRKRSIELFCFTRWTVGRPIWERFIRIPGVHGQVVCVAPGKTSGSRVLGRSKSISLNVHEKLAGGHGCSDICF